MSNQNENRQIRITRLLNASRDTVWDVWTKDEHLTKWWGPRGFTITTHSKDFRSGGHWHYTMHGPDGVDYPNRTVYHEVDIGKKLVYDHGGSEDRPPLFQVTVLFEEVEGKTRMDMTMTCPSAEEAIQTRAFIKQAGGDSTWDRLAEYVEKTTTGIDAFIIARSFDVPKQTMVDMWTNPDHLKNWLPPTGFTMRFIRVDLRTDGNSFYVMSNAAGMAMYGRADYLDIGTDTLQYTQQFCDANEVVTRHPASPTWPQTMLTTVRIAEEGPKRTRVTIQWQPYGNVNAEEVDTFVQARSGMTQGWTGSLDKLDQYALKN